MVTNAAVALLFVWRRTSSVREALWAAEARWNKRKGFTRSLFPVGGKLSLPGRFCKILTQSINVSFISAAEEAPRAILLMKVSVNESSVSSRLGSESSPRSGSDA